MQTLAIGAGALCLAPAAGAEEEQLDEFGGAHWLRWDDGWEYPIAEVDDEGNWIVEFDDDDYLVDPTGWVFDDAWYAIAALDSQGIWYDGCDGFVYLLGADDLGCATEQVV